MMVAVRVPPSQFSHCHFEWLQSLPAGFNPRTAIDALKSELVDAEDNGSLLEKFTYKMTLSYWFYKIEMWDEHKAYLEDAANLSNKSIPLSFVFHLNFIKMLKGVGRPSEMALIETCVERIGLYENLEKETQALILGVRGLTYLIHRPYELAHAQKSFEAAKDLDPSNYIWYMYLGNTFRHMGIFKNGVHSLHHNEILYYGQMMRFSGPTLLFCSSLIDMNLDKAKNGVAGVSYDAQHGILMDLKYKSLSARDYARLGRGLQLLPFPYKETDHSRDCFKEALSLRPLDPFINYTYGKFLMSTDQDTEACVYLKEAIEYSSSFDESFPARLRLIEAETKIDNSVNVASALIALLAKCQRPEHKSIICCHLGYYLKVAYPEVALLSYKNALKALAPYHNNDLQAVGTNVNRYVWQLQTDGSQKHLPDNRYKSENLKLMIQRLSERLP